MAVATGTQAERLTLTIEEAAATLGVSTRHLRTMIAEGEVPVARLGRRVLIVRTQLEAWLNDRAAVVA